MLRLFDIAEMNAIDEVIADAADAPDRPTLVLVHTHIGMGSTVVDTTAAHGAPLGTAGAAAAREVLRWDHPPFEIPLGVYDHWHGAVAERAQQHSNWTAAMARYRSAEPALCADMNESSLAASPTAGAMRSRASSPASGSPPARHPGRPSTCWQQSSQARPGLG